MYDSCSCSGHYRRNVVAMTASWGRLHLIARTMLLRVFLCGLCLLYASANVMDEVEGEWEYAGQTTAGGRSSECATTIKHVRAARWKNISPKLSVGESMFAIRWRDLQVNGESCETSSRKATATVLWEVKEGAPTAFEPFFVVGEDNSARICGSFVQDRPARYYFFRNAQQFRNYVSKSSLLTPLLQASDVANAPPTSLLMLSQQFVPASDGDVLSAVVCAYRRTALPAPTLSGAPSPSPSMSLSPTRARCFPGEATVRTRSGVKFMRQLQIGDIVHVGDGQWSSVYFFSHRDPSIRTTFATLTTKSGHSITLSHAHYVRLDNASLRAARDVHVGDRLRVGHLNLQSSSVVDVKCTSFNGLYAPHTLDGDLMVNDVLVSSYTADIPANVAHKLLAPLRALWSYCGIAITVPKSVGDLVRDSLLLAHAAADHTNTAIQLARHLWGNIRDFITPACDDLAFMQLAQTAVELATTAVPFARHVTSTVSKVVPRRIASAASEPHHQSPCHHQCVPLSIRVALRSSLYEHDTTYIRVATRASSRCSSSEPPPLGRVKCITSPCTP